jgi:hypothetical protein
MKIVRLIPVVGLLLASSLAGWAGSEMAPAQQDTVASAQAANGYWVPPYPPVSSYYYPPAAYYAPPPPAYYYGPGPGYYGYGPAFYGPPVGVFFGFGFHGRR